MSIQNCQLTCRAGKLCCTPQTICVDDCAWTVTVRGGPFNVALFPTGNTNEGTVLYGVTPADGTFTVAEPGVYTVDLDCAALDGTPCPDPLTAPYVCWERNCINGLMELQILEALEALCAKVGAIENVDLGPLCEKLESLISIMTAADFEAMCQKLLDAVTALEAVCEKLEATNTALDALCTKVENLIADLNAGLEAICKKIEGTNEILETLCKKIDALTALLTTELAAILVCLGVIKTEQEAQGTTLDQILICLRTLKDRPLPDIVECCTGGATDTTAKCANIPESWTAGSLGTWDTCTYEFGGISLPDDNYVFADFEALILGVGGTIAVNPNNADQYTICVPDGFTTCYSAACFRDGVGQLSRACVVSLPNTTEPECINFQRTWGKYEEPIANILTTQLDVQEDILEKACALADLIKEVPDACAESAVIGWCGRPANEAEYSYGGITENTLEAFDAAWEASGGKTWIAAEDGVSGGECHWFCPAIPGATFTINGEEAANGNVVVSPNPNAEALGCESTPAMAVCDVASAGALDALLAKACETADNTALSAAKLCLIEEHVNPAAPCPAEVPPEGLDKEAQTLTLRGDVAANYSAGQSINLQNVNGESCGSATAVKAAYSEETGLTTIAIEECDLDEGKTPVVIVKATPVKAATLTAIKTVKTLTAVKAVVITPIKVEPIVRG